MPNPLLLPQTAAAVEKAITDADLGLNPSSDGKVIRAKVPKASKEVRAASLKHLSESAELVRVAQARACMVPQRLAVDQVWAECG